MSCLALLPCNFFITARHACPSSLLLGFVHRLVVARKPIVRLTTHNVLRDCVTILSNTWSEMKYAIDQIVFSL